MNQLVDNFGIKTLNNTDILKLNFLPVNLLNLIESHRGLENFNQIEPHKYYLYTGRGPSQGSFHIGHLLGLELILEFQKFVKNKIYFMISDDEKIFRDKINLEQMNSNVQNTISQLNKLGFNDSNCDIRINSKGINESEYKNIIKLMTMTTINELNKIFGEKTHVGEYFYVFYQLMPCFLDKNKTAIIIAGIDQDPFFRLCRDIAPRIGFAKPIIIYTKNVIGLDGSPKMSTSNINSNPIFIDDTKEIIKQKILNIKYVGAGTLNELFDKGANLENDVPFKLIKIFDKNKDIVKLIEKAYTIGLETDSAEHEELKKYLDKGLVTRNKTMLTSFGIRQYLLNLICNIVSIYK